MKHLVKLIVLVESDETEVLAIGQLGLNRMVDLIASGYVVVDVSKSFAENVAVCVNVDQRRKKSE